MEGAAQSKGTLRKGVRAILRGFLAAGIFPLLLVEDFEVSAVIQASGMGQEEMPSRAALCLTHPLPWSGLEPRAGAPWNHTDTDQNQLNAAGKSVSGEGPERVWIRAPSGGRGKLADLLGSPGSTLGSLPLPLLPRLSVASAASGSPSLRLSVPSAPPLEGPSLQARGLPAVPHQHPLEGQCLRPRAAPSPGLLQRCGLPLCLEHRLPLPGGI